MLKQFVFVITLVFCVSALSLAQEDSSKGMQDPHNEIVNLKTDSKEPWNKVCPVMGNPIDKDSPTVEYNGKVYGFCCPGCDAKFEKSPEKYSKNLSEDGKRFIGKK